MSRIKDAVKDALAERDNEAQQRETDPPIRSLDDLRELSPEDVNRRWSEVQAVLEDRPLARDEDGADE